MIFTIGYAKLTPKQIEVIRADLDALIVDIRSKPMSRLPGFSKSKLEDFFGSHYIWKGDILGGGYHVTRASKPAVIWPEGISWLNKNKFMEKPMILLCLEEAPGECHRHWAALGSKTSVVHIFRNQMIEASELEKSINSGKPYPYRPLPKLG